MTDVQDLLGSRYSAIAESCACGWRFPDNANETSAESESGPFLRWMLMITRKEGVNPVVNPGRESGLTHVTSPVPYVQDPLPDAEML